MPIVAIIGVPRSGTSLIGKILDCHPRLSTWVEPYYIWDRNFRKAPNDIRTVVDATANIRYNIRKSFFKYRNALEADVVVDKSPRNCLKIPFIQQVFPEARYIFIYRDARDTVLSIKKQWNWKGGIFSDDVSLHQLKNRFHIIRRWLNRRPLWRFRLQSILFELGPIKNWPSKKFLNHIRWDGRFGWGPRFDGWQAVFDQVSPLEFNAYQWLHCARGIMEGISLIPEDMRYILRYEEFIQSPKKLIEEIFTFLDIEMPEHFMTKIPQIHANNLNKWRQAFSKNEKNRIGPITGQALIDWGYENDRNWYRSSGI